MAEPSPRRWFRFSLRTLFVAVTLLSCWLAWELSIVRERQAVLRGLQGRSLQIVTAESWTPVAYGNPPPQRAAVPLARRMLGDRAIQMFWQYKDTPGALSGDEAARLQRVFPEAEFREWLPEPCHPGCFPVGTLVETPRGPRAIETLGVGDVVTTVAPGGKMESAQIQSVFITSNTLWRISTEQGELLTTRVQPLCVTYGEILPAGKLQVGDRLLVLRDNSIVFTNVTEVAGTDRLEKVINLVLGDSQVFIAGGFLARSKPPRR